MAGYYDIRCVTAFKKHQAGTTIGEASMPCLNNRIKIEHTVVIYIT